LKEVTDRLGAFRIVVAAALLLSLAAFAGFTSPASAAVLPDPTTPVVLVMMDELPTASLMNQHGGIDARRFPHIAGFAAHSTWYRDNVAAGDFTGWAIPPILTGNLSNRSTLPTNAVQPHNIFNLLGTDDILHVHEELTEMCSVALCPDGHQGEATGETEANEFVKAKFHNVDIGSVRQWTRTIPAGDNTLSVIHLLLPHQPHRYTPEGLTYPGGPLGFTVSSHNDIWEVSDAGVALNQQRHMLQLAFADRLVGNILEKVKRNGDWKHAMVIVTADHGDNFDETGTRRGANDRSIAGVVNPPLMIKYPGQTTGQVSETPTQNLDIVPTIAKQLGITDLYPTDGKPIDELSSSRVYTVSQDFNNQMHVTGQQVREQRQGVLATMKRRFGTGPIWKLGPRPDLIGMKPGKRAAKAGARATIDNPERLDRINLTRGPVPSLLSAVVEKVGDNQTIAVAVNGKIAATTRTFEYAEAMRFGAMIPPSAYRRKNNSVAIYRVGAGNRLVLIKQSR